LKNRPLLAGAAGGKSAAGDGYRQTLKRQRAPEPAIIQTQRPTGFYNQLTAPVI